MTRPSATGPRSAPSIGSSRKHVEDLVGLLEQVRHEGAVRLDTIPGALGRAASPPGAPAGAISRPSCGAGGELGNEERGQVIGLERAVEVPPPDPDHLLVLEAEMVQEHHFGHGAVSVIQTATA